LRNHPQAECRDCRGVNEHGYGKWEIENDADQNHLSLAFSGWNENLS
jgi:hypothetical protein